MPFKQFFSLVYDPLRALSLSPLLLARFVYPVISRWPVSVFSLLFFPYFFLGLCLTHACPSLISFGAKKTNILHNCKTESTHQIKTKKSWKKNVYRRETSTKNKIKQVKVRALQDGRWNYAEEEGEMEHGAYGWWAGSLPNITYTPRNALGTVIAHKLKPPQPAGAAN